MKRGFEAVKRIVIKTGTSFLVLPNGKISLAKIDQLASVISSLVRKGKEIVLVPSGAMGFGLNVLNMKKRPADMAQQQTASSVGQVTMISLYSQIFSRYRMTVSQILLTRDMVEYPESLANVTNAFESLFSTGVIPIVNKNDAVGVDEMDHATKFGGDDRLSAVMAKIVKTDLLIMLSDIDGLFDKNPAVHADARSRSHVADITEETVASVGGSGSKFGMGGMLSKIKSVQMMFEHHGQMVLMSSANPRDIFQALDGALIGTWFVQGEQGGLVNCIEQLGKNAQEISKTLISLGSAEKNNLLCQAATALVEQARMILVENIRDLAVTKENSISDIMLDRLHLSHERIKGITEGVGQVVDLQDPIGQVIRDYTSLDGLKIVQRRVPLGAVTMIFESRPNVSVDAFSLTLKTGNAITLCGGRDVIHSNTALIVVIRQTLV